MQKQRTLGLTHVEDGDIQIEGNTFHPERMNITMTFKPVQIEKDCWRPLESTDPYWTGNVFQKVDNILFK